MRDAASRDISGHR